MSNEILIIIITAICSGSLSWVFTIKWTRQQAKSDAMKSVQQVYQDLVTDLKTDRDALKTEIRDLRERLVSVESKCREYETQIKEAERKIDSMKPLICLKHGCKERCYEDDSNNKS